MLEFTPLCSSMANMLPKSAKEFDPLVAGRSSSDVEKLATLSLPPPLVGSALPTPELEEGGTEDGAPPSPFPAEGAGVVPSLSPVVETLVLDSWESGCFLLKRDNPGIILDDKLL